MFILFLFYFIYVIYNKKWKNFCAGRLLLPPAKLINDYHFFRRKIKENLQDNEVDASHPLKLMQDRLAIARDLQIIELKPLARDDLASLIEVEEVERMLREKSSFDGFVGKGR